MADEAKKAPKPDEKKAEASDEKKEKSLSPDAKREKKKEAKQGQEKKVKKVDYGPDFKHRIRIANTDLDGTHQTWLALTGVRGVGPRMGALIADHAGVPRRERLGKLTDAQIETLTKAVDNIAAFAPSWAVNRPFDVETGDDMHLVGSNVEILLREDLNRLQKIASYRGVRHQTGQKVRGQRSRSNGRTGLTVGVSRIKAVEEKKEEGAAEKGGAPAAGGKPAAPAAGGKPAAPAAGGKPAAAPAGGKPAAPAAGGAKPGAKPEGGKK